MSYFDKFNTLEDVVNLAPSENSLTLEMLLDKPTTALCWLTMDKLLRDLENLKSAGTITEAQHGLILLQLQLEDPYVHELYDYYRASFDKSYQLRKR